MSFYTLKRNFFKIRYQIVILLFFVTLLPIISVQIFNYFATSQKLLMKNSALLEDNLILTNNNLNNLLGDYNQILFQISTDSACIDSISRLNTIDESSIEYKRLGDTLTTVISSNILMHPEIKAVGIIGKKDSSYLYVQKRENTEELISFFQEKKDDLRSDKLLPSPEIDVIPWDSPYYNSEFPYFYLSSRVIDYEKLSVIGSIVLFIEPSKINMEINNSTSKAYEYSDKILLDDQGYILCSKTSLCGIPAGSFNGYEGVDFSDVPENGASISQGNYYISSLDLDYFNLHLVNVVDYTLLNQDIHTLWLNIILVIAIILILTLLFAFLLSRNFILSIEKLAESINQVDENHLDIHIDTKSHNEMEIIENSVNKMLSQIRNLLSENKQQYEHIVEITKKACDAELKSMELQINPHFLFNTIDSINWTAIRENCTDVSEQLKKLAYILRYTVYNINTVVSVKEEILWLTQYLDLQQLRFHNAFSYYVFIQPEAYDLSIHKLLLQPFLENSIIHGFENITWHGQLEIRFRILKKEYLLISILDNGCGLSENQIVSMNQFFSQKSDVFAGVGLANISYRLRSYYPHHKLMVSSSSHTTVFKLFIPIKEMEDTHV